MFVVVITGEGQLTTYIEQMVQLYTSYTHLAGPVRRDIEIANFFEIAANTIVGTDVCLSACFSA